jgi:hypothetical protein
MPDIISGYTFRVLMQGTGLDWSVMSTLEGEQPNESKLCRVMYAQSTAGNVDNLVPQSFALVLVHASRCFWYVLMLLS